MLKTFQEIKSMFVDVLLKKKKIFIFKIIKKKKTKEAIHTYISHTYLIIIIVLYLNIK